MSLIEIRGLSFRYAGSEKPALSNINLDIEKGDFVLVVGPSGGGKSTLCRCINGLIPQFYEGEYSGKVVVDGYEAAKTPTYLLSQIVGMVFQNPQNQLFALSVEADVAFPLENLGLPRDEIISRIEEAMTMLNVQDLRDRSPFELSGGQQQRVAIASVLAMKPKILILDEPTSYLDPVSSLSLLNNIDEIRRKLGLTVLLVEHRVDLAAAKANRIVVIADGKLIFEGDHRKFFEEFDAHTFGVSTPKVTLLSRKLKARVKDWNMLCLSAEEFDQAVRRLVGRF
ncbi:MAG: ABC transporter ATP-binding protein [Candidatus Caldarchaeum sp.]|nr:energy-coupling factor ABC transporter ATP-binding protein [Candidatus Caldarchaeum sp.]MDW8062653.1 ABC transporter ATP-binding protein [Candidatus Caldarchaeum sp.]MDW8436077.1 ABC transporter ATP-binding protein [Candidatus Caldarchaeum sp.]